MTHDKYNMMTWPRRLVPERLGGLRYNVFNTFVRWLKTPSEARPSLIKCFKPWTFWTEIIELNRAPLWNWIRRNKPDRILEVGLGDGCNAMKMIELAGNCTYYCFDNLSYNLDLRNYRKLRSRSNTRFYIGDTVRTLPRFSKSLPEMDLIFIDGAHDEEHVGNDWNFCRKLMHSSTACFFHDYDMRGVRRVVDGIDRDGFNVEVLTPKGHEFALVEKCD